MGTFVLNLTGAFPELVVCTVYFLYVIKYGRRRAGQPPMIPNALILCYTFPLRRSGKDVLLVG